MDILKEFTRIGRGITSSPSKGRVLKERLDSFTVKLKRSWYKKLLNKLISIDKGDISLADYIKEVESKIN